MNNIVGRGGVGSDGTHLSIQDLYCAECSAEQACGSYHIYAIELVPEVRERYKDYCRGELDHVTGESRYFYVGETKHRVGCRFKQHRATKRRRARGFFFCTCEKVTRQKQCFAYHKGNKFVRTHARKPGALRAELFRQLNPIGTDLFAATAAEAQLAQRLKDLGHAAYYR